MSYFHNALILIILCLIVGVKNAQNTHSFTIDPVEKTFLKDGVPFRYVSGSFHYFRSIQENWKSIMTKMKSGGLNVLETYVEWSSHEPEPGYYNFNGNLDLVTFLKTAQQVGLLVVLRPGPYICAERDMGGLPYWLLREKPDIQMRTMDPVYINYVNKWFDVLLPMMKPLLYKNGGPIILVQVENEYGQYDKCDTTYMTYLRNKTWDNLDSDVILFRTDMAGDQFYKCDYVEGVMVTADFGTGTNVKNAFEVLRKHNPTQPMVVTEFYPGWMDHWGEKHASVNSEEIVKTLDDILANNGSVNFYMYYGGTNYGFTNGANTPYKPQPTSYDYDAPITEAGDLTDKFFKIREVIGKYLPLPPKPSPDPSIKLSLGPLELIRSSSLLDAMPFLKPPKAVHSEYPKTFEALGCDKGFVIYATIVTFQTSDPVVLKADGVRDRGYVFLNKEFKGILSRAESAFEIPLTVVNGDEIMIVVENQGRINYGEEMKDFKGILSNVTLGTRILDQWTMSPVPIQNINAIHNLGKHVSLSQSSSFRPGFYNVNFTLPKGTPPSDTFLDPTGWYRGVAFLNDMNLGRYWPIVGPQVTLYVPGQFLKPYPDLNFFSVLELEGTPCGYGRKSVSSCANTMKFVTNPVLDGPVPSE